MKTSTPPLLQSFIAGFCQWAIEYGMHEQTRRRLPAAIRRAVLMELPKRDSYQMAVFRELQGSEGLVCDQLAPDLVVLGTDGLKRRDTKLVAGVTCPEWRGGWRDIDRDEDIGNTFWYFFHAVRTYIIRSRLLRCTAAISLTYGRACDFRHGDQMWELLIGPDRGGAATFDAAVDKLMRESHLRARQPRSTRKLREFQAWVSRLNVLDPYVHRMLYQYIRAVRLRTDDSYEDALTSLDSVVEVAAQFVRDRLGARSARRRRDLVPVLGLSHADDKHLGQLFALRSYFGAHPGESGWWDVRDNYYESTEHIFSAVKRLVEVVAQAEERHRVVDPQPTLWSEWFLENASVISRPVWFRFDGPPWVPLSQS